MSVLFYYDADDSGYWLEALRCAGPEFDFVHPDPAAAKCMAGDPAVEAAVAWAPPAGLLDSFPNLACICSLGAGIDHLVPDGCWPRAPVVRLVDPSIARRMAGYVLTAVYRFHYRFDLYEAQQRGRVWREHTPPEATNLRIGVMGLGALGRHVAEVLRDHGYTVAGWSRSAKAIDGVETYADHGDLDLFLRRSDVLVCLLPLTEETRGILGAETFARLPEGAAVISIGRGEHLDPAALLAALDTGKLRGAVLDTFETEPLPVDSPLWQHERVLVTPHVAGVCGIDAAARRIVATLRQARAGEPLEHVVQPQRGY
ncbi:MAG TPA: glyoxylate/hydroxypyruvate reductase A [Alphaproteobacteria bacterium]|nr:glyoxylate/hydroxypyruvate reductase A [Alphaproteobacteria bacterium]